MTDLHALKDAFAELERRADAVSAAMPLELPARDRSLSRLVPVAATVTAVAGVAAGVALLVPGGDPGTPAGGSASGTTHARPAPTPAQPPRSMIPRDGNELADRFRAVLGGTATFTVTETAGGAAVITLPPSAPPTRGGQQAPLPNSQATVGATIIGTLTASGHTGGFQLGIYPGTIGQDTLWCGEEHPDPARCSVTTYADGAKLVVGHERLEGSPQGVDNWVDLIRTDGVEIDLHVSNQRNPKGDSEELGPTPPLSTEAMIAIVTSNRWWA